MRALISLIVTVVSALAAAQPRLGPPQAIAPGLLAPAPGITSEVAGAPLDGGYLVAWASHDFIRFARLNAAGELIDEVPRAIPAICVQNLMVVSNGTGVLAGWSCGSGALSSWSLAALDGSKPTITQRGGRGSLDGLLYDGNHYLALFGVSIDQPEIAQLDTNGLVIASAALGFPDPRNDITPWRSRFFIDRGVAWLVMRIDGHLMRLALTDANGKPQRPVVERLPIEQPFASQLQAAGQIEGRWYVIYDDYPRQRRCMRFLDAAEPIVLEGFSYLLYHASQVVGGELYVFGVLRDGNRGLLRGMRISAAGRMRSFEIGSGSFAGVIGSIPIPRGILLLTANQVHTLTTTYAPPVAQLIRTLAERTFIRPPTVLHWAVAKQFDVTLAAHGPGFLAVWHQQNVEGMEVWSRLLDRNGKPAGEPRRLGLGLTANIASNGEIALVVWGNDGVVQARRLDSAGIPLGDPIPLDRATKAHIIGAGWDGAQFAVAWATEANLSFTAVAAGGEVLGAEPVRLDEPSVAVAREESFAVSPFGALLVYPGPRRGARGESTSTVAVRLSRDLRPAGRPFEVVGIPAHYRHVIWTGEHYLVTLTHDLSLRAARVSPSGEPLDAPYGVWLGRGWLRHDVADANGNVLVIFRETGVVTDRELRRTEAFRHEGQSFNFGALAMRDDGAALLGYTESPYRTPADVALVRTIDLTRE